MKPIIEIEGIGKKYKINHEMGGYVTLRDVITNIFKSPFAFLKTKTKQIIGMETKEVFWALKDINFTVEKGEVIGIIGRNGAGKSTLLKILSQITPPTTGEIKINGTVGSLLEVGTGFHPELTGRENIFLNGAILGMKRKDIVRKFEEIVKFADIEKFLDTPVKFYSSGMYVRLAFSVAAHMDTDILIIDEVLAVGDSEFQKKCLGKMNDITKNEGRTILFVSHNMDVIKQLCKRGILLKEGTITYTGDIENVINQYVINKGKNTNEPEIKIVQKHRKFPNDNIEIISVGFKNIKKNNTYNTNQSLEIWIKYKSNYSTKDCRVSGSISTIENKRVGIFFDNKKFTANKEGVISFILKNHNLAPGQYYFNLSIGKGDYVTGNKEFDIIYECLYFEISNENEQTSKWNKDWGNILFQVE
ncbi:MAG: ABC transporter ATP-binding protein [Candidatus Paceibacterota bacterium]|jgi:lipopolysaccharide transport system ATP-binding protein